MPETNVTQTTSEKSLADFNNRGADHHSSWCERSNATGRGQDGKAGAAVSKAALDKPLMSA